MRVPELRGDPLPGLYQRMPLVEVPGIGMLRRNDVGFVKSQLYLPVHKQAPS
jgi:hypothetical protein